MRTGERDKEADMKEDNRGFSFVELLVVMAIMLIGITTAYNIYGYLDMANSKKLVANIQSVMNSARTESMTYGGDIKCNLSISSSDGKTYIQIFKQDYTTDASGNIVWTVDGSGNPVYASTPSSSMELGNEIVEATLEIKAPSSGKHIAYMNYNLSSNMAGFDFSYKRSTGGFSKITCGSVDQAAGVEDSHKAFANPMTEVPGASYALLTIKTSTGQSSSLKLYFITGRIEQV